LAISSPRVIVSDQAPAKACCELEIAHGTSRTNQDSHSRGHRETKKRWSSMCKQSQLCNDRKMPSAAKNKTTTELSTWGAFTELTI